MRLPAFLLMAILWGNIPVDFVLWYSGVLVGCWILKIALEVVKQTTANK